ncbi:MAG: multidrug ABC transporter substrate-binding protein [Candidatus Portnoybacteria bacterium CG10_big_fil_rev_8_21_14_0_10_36_7]|uniref:Multidrug ABC transporter substrate-binding protein n=1 Tax=Candidatus Portnoybacteria bacterium CG10_big_fil_rev_8_21_14_0_10_36_7 TaxID=1974812 RepID=A0A2M8KF66_9BACT|nr:MAG: multidrug ABC transporter substrate-binding protein [Candidatus Portnoybacteria bacterium CG10_big_fil_rev_8_21_14_0_10_36_7]
MNLLNTFKTAIGALIANKKRAGLTILGIIIGIAAVIIIISVSQGAQSIILNQVKALGAKTILVEPGREPKGPSDASEILSNSLKLADYEVLLQKNNNPYIDNATAFVMSSAHILYQNKEERASLAGVMPSYQAINNFYPVEGRFITDDESKTGANVIVLGDTIKNDIFGLSNAIGETVRIKNKRFRIIGVMDRKGAAVGGLDYDKQVFVPIKTAQDMLGIKHVNIIMLTATETEYIQTAADDIKRILRQRHGIINPDNDDFHVITQEDIANTLSLITSVLTILLGSVAAISLIVGGIGIMNIMLVSVAERTQEIGLRKSVGATNKNILLQFLLEAIILTLLGGIIGIIIGISFSAFIAFIMNQLDYSWDLIIPIYSLFLSSGVASFIGLVFGIYPAKAASKLNPIDALRYE